MNKLNAILGIDYGRRKIGISIAYEMLAQAYGVIRYETTEEAINKLKGIIKKEDIGKIVVGISEGRMANETREFVKKLATESKIKIVFQDETLSTRLAQSLSIQAKIRRKKRRLMEDAYAATIILQDYLDLKS